MTPPKPAADGVVSIFSIITVVLSFAALGLLYLAYQAAMQKPF
jgi:hypothetical protein